MPKTKILNTNKNKSGKSISSSKNKSNRTGRSSNYSYGRSRESMIGKEIKNLIGGSSYRRSSGSRGPSDVRIYKGGKQIIDIQIKSSRYNSSSTNRCSFSDISKIKEFSKKNNTLGLYANSKGKSFEVRNSNNGKLLLKK